MDFVTWHLVVLLIEWSIRLVMLPVIVSRKDNPSTCLAWLAVVFFVPELGVLLYLLLGEIRLGRKKLSRRMRRRMKMACGARGEVEAAFRVGDDLSADRKVLVRLAERVGGLPVVTHNTVSFVPEANNAIDRLVADIDGACHHVNLLFYIYEPDETGRRVADALARAVERGAACRVLADAVGSAAMFKKLADPMRRRGVRVVPVLPVRLLRRTLARLDIRNHRKLAVIDGRVAYTGSLNIASAASAGSRRPKMVDLMARITGPAVRQLQGVFLEDWYHETDELPDEEHLFPPCGREGDAVVQVVPSGPDQPTEAVQDLMVAAVHEAQRHVIVTTPYFVPDEAMLLALRLSAARGAHVDVVVPRRTDHPLVDLAGTYYLHYLMRHGVHVHRFPDGLLHTKLLTIDDSLAAFGSGNFDIRSFHLNFELNLMIHDAACVSELRGLQIRYLEASEPAKAEDWLAMGRLRRLACNLAKLLSPLL